MEQKAVNIRVVRIVTFVCVAAVVVVLAAAFVGNGMTKDIGRDEQMYCTAGVLVSEGKTVYRDFTYPSQLPYHPLLLAGLYKMLHTRHFLLVGRLVSSLCDILVMVSILGIYRSIFGRGRLDGLLFGLTAVVLYAFNPFVAYAAGYAWNHDIVILCVVLSLWLFVTTDFRQKSRYWRSAAMGGLLTAATCMRITTALVELTFFVGLVATTVGSRGDKSRTVLPFSIAGLIVLAWPAWIVAQAPRVFWMNLVQIPALYGNWLHQIGMTHSKAALTVAALTTPSYLVLVVVAGYCVWTQWHRRASIDAQTRMKAGLTALLPAIFLVIAYIPPTMWRQYLAVPVPFIAIALAYPLAQTRNPSNKKASKTQSTVASYLIGAAAVVAALTYPALLQGSLAVLVPEHWTPIVLHRTSEDIASKVKESRLVCTLGPLQALEGGCQIYPELACGAIVYRVADLMSDRQRQATHAVGPATLNEMLQERPPEAILVGVDPSYEDPLRQMIPPHWPREVYDTGWQVYVRPRSTQAGR